MNGLGQGTLSPGPSRQQPVSANEKERTGLLDSWKEIARYVGRDVRTVQRWEKGEKLPVHRHIHEKRASVYAFQAEMDAWRASRGFPQANTTFVEPVLPELVSRKSEHPPERQLKVPQVAWRPLDGSTQAIILHYANSPFVLAVLDFSAPGALSKESHDGMDHAATRRD